MKILDILNQAKKDNKLIEAEILLSDFLKKDKSFLISHSEFEIPSDILRKFKKVFKKILNGYPIAYILKKKEFFGREFYVDERVLIPRPETECLIEEIMNRDMPHIPIHIFDVGTGSGCIGITLALEFLRQRILKKDLQVILSDINKDALEVARINAVRFEIEEICEIVKADLLDFNGQLIHQSFNKNKCGKNFNIIVANLPYIGKLNNNFIQENVRKYEPSEALFSGNDGLDLYRKFLDQVATLKPDICAFEFGDGQKNEFEDLIKEKLSNYEYKFYKDLAGLWRVVIIRKLM